MSDAGSSTLARYDAMCRAIAECVRVDEAKDIRDKALALEAYYRQARNHEAEREASEIRLRAERRSGELLKELAQTQATERNPQGLGGHTGKVETSATANKQVSPYAQALANTRMSPQQASRFRALADVPPEIFEQALAKPDGTASTSAIIKAAKDAVGEAVAPRLKIDPNALWIWGRLREFERGGYGGAILDVCATDILTTMTSEMVADVRRLTPVVIAYLAELREAADAYVIDL